MSEINKYHLFIITHYRAQFNSTLFFNSLSLNSHFSSYYSNPNQEVGRSKKKQSYGNTQNALLCQYTSATVEEEYFWHQRNMSKIQILIIHYYMTLHPINNTLYLVKSQQLHSQRVWFKFGTLFSNFNMAEFRTWFRAKFYIKVHKIQKYILIHVVCEHGFFTGPFWYQYSENLLCYSQYYTGFTTGEIHDVLSSRLGRQLRCFLSCFVQSRPVSSSEGAKTRSSQHHTFSEIFFWEGGGWCFSHILCYLQHF